MAIGANREKLRAGQSVFLGSDERMALAGGSAPPTRAELEPGANQRAPTLTFIDFECARRPISARAPLDRARDGDGTRSLYLAIFTRDF